MTRLEHRINRVLDHINQHPHGDLSLETLAAIAGLSRFHFHRLFKDQTAEPLNAFVNRQRLERAIKELRADRDLTLTDAALNAGFSSLSDFSRTFKSRYTVAASRWNRRDPLQVSKIRQTGPFNERYTDLELASPPFVVAIQRIPAQTLAYIRVTKPYEGSRLQRALYEFHSALDAARLTVTGELLGLSLNDPDVTPLEQCLYDWAIPIAETVQLKTIRHGLTLRSQPAFRVASITVHGDIKRVDAAWHYLYRHWLPVSPYLPAHLPAVEHYRQPPDRLDWHTWHLDCWLPIEEASE